MKKSEKYTLAMKAVIESGLNINDKLDVLAVLFKDRDSAVFSEEYAAKKMAVKEDTENG